MIDYIIIETIGTEYHVTAYYKTGYRELTEVTRKVYASRAGARRAFCKLYRDTFGIEYPARVVELNVYYYDYAL